MPGGGRPGRRRGTILCRGSPQTVETSVVVILVRGGARFLVPAPGLGRPGPARWLPAPYRERARGSERRRSCLLCPARAAGPPRSRGVPSRQGQLVIHREAHAQRRVPPAVVVFLDPGGDPGPGRGLGAEMLEPAQLELKGGVPGLDHRVTRTTRACPWTAGCPAGRTPPGTGLRWAPWSIIPSAVIVASPPYQARCRSKGCVSSPRPGTLTCTVFRSEERRVGKECR